MTKKKNDSNQNYQCYIIIIKNEKSNEIKKWNEPYE